MIDQHTKHKKKRRHRSLLSSTRHNKVADGIVVSYYCCSLGAHPDVTPRTKTENRDGQGAERTGRPAGCQAERVAGIICAGTYARPLIDIHNLL